MKKINVIIDTDPGVDDAIAIIPALFDKKINVLLFTTVTGNVGIEQNTRNMLHILEKCNKKIPVAKGASKPLFRETKNAKFIHGEDGSGKYEIKVDPKTKEIEKDAVEAMYEVICNHKKDISLLLIGPQTNAAKLLQKHPDVKSMITRIICEGSSEFGCEKITPFVKKEYISFNASSDPEALQIVLNSGIPTTIIPSEIGRAAFLTAEQVEKIKENKVVGKMMYEMLNGYWEPNIDVKIVAMNDTCAILNLTHPHLFKTKKAYVEVDTNEKPGKTVYNYDRRSHIKIVKNVNFKKFHKVFFKNLKNIEKSLKNR